MKINILTLMIMFCISNALYAESKIDDKPSQKLPFIGERSFNFYGGNWNEECIKINKNGQTTIYNCGTGGGAGDVEYKGKYKNPLPGGYLIHNNKIFLLNEKGELTKDCKGDGAPCIEELYGE